MRLTTTGVALMGSGAATLVAVVASSVNATISRKQRAHERTENREDRALTERVAGRPERAALYVDLMELLGQVDAMAVVIDRARIAMPDGGADFTDPWEPWPEIANRARLHASPAVFTQLETLASTWKQLLAYCRQRWTDRPMYADKQAVNEWVVATGRPNAMELDVLERVQDVQSKVQTLRETMRSELHPGT